jgi:hypothetical protein
MLWLYFVSYFRKVGSCNLRPLCLFIILINYKIAEQIVMNLGMYVVARKSIWTAYFTNASQSLAHDSGRTLVRAECGYPKGSPDTNS